ncbi:DNA cross-link repair protein pso2/snm1 [Ceratocystis fimbriata CBS 114723]|uniref:DNA cross-link repair protein pso2/snm1 n=1 Tax=Ceratocystis fimbriata CBS 114723 TaxID=1035309 RepID=A0A2C5WVJ9_9PEZI|nr:DNA cross-link repair protein pso2/snm1 [Ceratocystis fimbriata CBS 114723]
MAKFDFGKRKKPAQTKIAFPKLTPEEVEAANEKKKAKPTTTILSFFKKVDQDVLFISEDAKALSALNRAGGNLEEKSPDEVDIRYNESNSPVKRRKLSSEPELPETIRPEMPPLLKRLAENQDQQPSIPSSPSKGASKVGGFVFDDSDSETEPLDENRGESAAFQFKSRASSPSPMKPFMPHETSVLEELLRKAPASPPPVSTSANPEVNEDLSNDHEDDDELFLGANVIDIAEEEREAMLAIRELDRREAALNGIVIHDDEGDFHAPDQEDKPMCPICYGSLQFASSDEATRHVNSCIDGNPTPLPTGPRPQPQAKSSSSSMFQGRTSLASKAAVPRPGQANPFQPSLTTANTALSAFSKLMAARVENKAWSEASDQEQASKGKPAHTRTCPFYKIMPGFSICVDAFRYGAVQGCKAYFLSHFHSDHYIGLSSSWCHGPIYCSKVTGALMKKQLRVAAKWIVELEWDVCTEVPGTDGATVTMIPANHCPGSSLFLFEKKMLPAAIKKQRILHCGDFRACTDHVTHPLLRPETIDAISGKVQQQKIDICYLDTTYLDPRYAFPPQDDVISACAELCSEISANPDLPCELWDRLQKGTKPKKPSPAAISKFFSNNTPQAQTQTTLPNAPDKKLLVICGTYSIGKERVCVGIAKAMKTKIFAPSRKLAICKLLDDPTLTALLTSDPLAAQVHLQSLGEIRADVIEEYRRNYGTRFSRVIAFRPSGWTYHPPAVCSDGSRAPPPNSQPGQVPTTQLLHGAYWRARFNKSDVTAVRGATKTAMCLGVPYSEHSSFRELALFVMSLNIERVVPTVNVGSDAARKKMKGWIDRWISERRRGGLLTVLEGDEDSGQTVDLWDGKIGKSGGVWW